MERNKGITLIALIITIIVMLILIAVSVQLLIDSDLIGTSEKTANLFQTQANKESNLGIDSIVTEENGKTVSDYLDSALQTQVNCIHEEIETVEGVEFATTTGTIEVIWLDTKNNIISNPNIPELGDGMTRVAWDESSEEFTPTSTRNWYNYVAGSGTSDNTSSLWANAKTEDGSYWVWIPRFAYRITYYNSSGQVSGFSNGEGIVSVDGVVQSELETGIETVVCGCELAYSYIVHPAFMDDSENNYENGGWDSDLSGIWVAKFEMSMEKNGTATTTSSSSIGNVTTTDAIKVVSKPNVTSWRYITVGKAYTNSLNYNTELESHLMKNSEWGAVAYLTHSQYGRNGNEITINSSSSYYTGGGDYATNVAQSSTGNIYGIYDLRGGAWERVAAWDTLSSSSNIKSYGSSFASTGGSSTKYATTYSNGTSNMTYSAVDIYNVGKTGDSTKELYTGGTGDYANWFSDLSHFVFTTYPFFKWGGDYSYGEGSGSFASGTNAGNYYAKDSFRVVLIGLIK